MRLVTFTRGDGVERAGALFDKDQSVIDLQVAYQQVQGRESGELSSVLKLVEGGEAALELARSLLSKAPTQQCSSAPASSCERRFSRRRKCATARVSNFICARHLLPPGAPVRCVPKTRKRR